MNVQLSVVGATEEDLEAFPARTSVLGMQIFTSGNWRLHTVFVSRRPPLLVSKQYITV